MHYHNLYDQEDQKVSNVVSILSKEVYSDCSLYELALLFFCVYMFDFDIDCDKRLIISERSLTFVPNLSLLNFDYRRAFPKKVNAEILSLHHKVFVQPPDRYRQIENYFWEGS